MSSITCSNCNDRGAFPILIYAVVSQDEEPTWFRVCLECNKFFYEYENGEVVSFSRMYSWPQKAEKITNFLEKMGHKTKW